MFELRDLFQWERFITPSIIKIFYWLSVGLSLLFGVAGILGGLAQMFVSPIGGLITVIGSLIGDADRRDLRAHHLGIRADHVPDQRAPRRHPQPGRDVAQLRSSPRKRGPSQRIEPGFPLSRE